MLDTKYDSPPPPPPPPRCAHARRVWGRHGSLEKSHMILDNLPPHILTHPGMISDVVGFVSICLSTSKGSVVNIYAVHTKQARTTLLSQYPHKITSGDGVVALSIRVGRENRSWNCFHSHAYMADDVPSATGMGSTSDPMVNSA